MPLPSRRRFFQFSLIFCFIFIISACSQTSVATPEPVVITIGGATGMHPVLHALTETFTKQNPHVLFELRSGGSQLGGTQVQNGQIDLAASVIFITEDADDETFLQQKNEVNNSSSPENDAVPSEEIEEVAPLMHMPIGIDGIAILVHASNNIRGISSGQLQKLYRGTIWDWEKIGSNRGEVLLISREDGSGARTLFEERIMEGGAVSLTAVVMPTSADVVSYIAKQPDAIGYVSRAYVAELLNPPTGQSVQDNAMLSSIRVLSLDRTRPTIEELETQTYAFAHTLYLVSRDEPQGWTRQFIEFVLGPVGQEIVSQYHARVR